MSITFKKTLKSAAGCAAGAAGAVARHASRMMTIVAFHRVNDEITEDGITCNSRKFAAFCRFFSENFRVIPLHEQVDGCRRGIDMGGTLSVTFDDGYADNFSVAAPILRGLNLPATFFVTTGFIGSTLVAPWDVRLSVPQKWMSWGEIRELSSAGFDIGSHGHEHVNLSTSDRQLVRSDLETSKIRLEQELGAPVRLFAYPFGGVTDISEQSRDLVREIGFNCCLSCFGGVNPKTSDPFRLRRIGIGEWFISPHQFAFEYILGRV